MLNLRLIQRICVPLALGCGGTAMTGCAGGVGKDGSGDAPAAEGMGNAGSMVPESHAEEAGSGSEPPLPSGIVDPGRVAIHRLNNLEYNNTVRDLLGTALQPGSTFFAEEGLHFDNTATSLGMTPTQYDGYLKAANQLMEDALAHDEQRARFLTCVPAAVADPCARQIIESFGKRIYRRPLEVSEVDRAMKVYEADLVRSGDGTEAVAQALRAMLSAASFLYRIEYDTNPASAEPHALNGYELASRLSYFQWSTMPDNVLLDAAESGALLDTVALEQTVDRMLLDPRVSAFVESFAGQWLDIRKLVSHSITPQLFPTYSGAVSDALMSEGYNWFQEFLEADYPLTDWFTADFNYVNDASAAHYGFPSLGTGEELARVAITTDQRVGFLGLGSFLTHTSFPSRTSPTLRGVWVLSELLCSPPPLPPGNIPDLNESAEPMDAAQPSGSENVRERLERHRTDPACSVCHQILDPVGLGLERFDAVGRYREAYGNGDTIPPDGVLPDGTPFAGLTELGQLLGQDARFTACVARTMFTYALGREVETFDTVTLQSIRDSWDTRGVTLKNLMKEIVLSDAFRFRRGEVE